MFPKSNLVRKLFILRSKVTENSIFYPLNTDPRGPNVNFPVIRVLSKEKRGKKTPGPVQGTPMMEPLSLRSKTEIEVPEDPGGAS